MRCDDMIELLSCYIDGEVSPEERAVVEKHIGECESCRKLVEEMASIRRALSELTGADVPPDLHEGIMKAVTAVRKSPSTFDQKRGSRPQWNWLGWMKHARPSWVMPAVAGALAMLMVVGSFGIIRDLATKRGAVSPQYRADETSKEGESSPASQSGSTSDQAQKSLRLAEGATQPGATGPAGEEVYSASALVTERKVIRNARMTVSVSRGGVRDALNRACTIIEGAGGYVESSSLVTADAGIERNPEACVVGRVPAENLTKTMQDIGALGKVVDQSESAQDVTEKYIDLSARVKAKEAQEARLIQIMGEAKNVAELLQVEAELWRVRADIDSMKGQLNYLEQSSALSSLTVNFLEEGAVVGIQKQSFWREVREAFVAAWKGIFVFGAKILPWVTVLALVVGVPLAVAFRFRRRVPA